MWFTMKTWTGKKKNKKEAQSKSCGQIRILSFVVIKIDFNG